MGLIFGKKKPISRVTDQDRAVLQLKQQRDKLKQYQRRIESSLESNRVLAKKLLNEGKKDRAKLLLRKKRYQEQLLAQTDGQLENLEHMTHDIEFAQIEVQVVDGLKRGNEALKKVNEVLNLDDIEKLLEETKEGIEKQNELSELLSGQLTAEDEDAVAAELDQIVADSLPEVPQKELPALPEVPDDDVQTRVPLKRKKIEEPVALEA